MRYSILLTTYGREEECITCLTRLKSQVTAQDELLLLDDLHIRSETLNKFCDDNNFKYVHTGSQKNNKPKWRVPGFALNIGAKMSTGNSLILGNAEIWQVSEDTLNKMDVNNKIAYPRIYDQPRNKTLENYKTFRKLEGRYPFFLQVPRKTFFDIGGYDEDFTGYAWEDTDLCYRLELVIDHVEVDADVIHLWNPRGHTNRVHSSNITTESLSHNKNLFYERKGRPVRNIGREWGIL